MVKIHLVNLSPNALPEYATPGSAGMDIRAYLEKPVTLQPLERALVPTGLYFELPPGMEAQVRPRSGLALKQGITCLNSPGTIDSDYRGEIKVLLINLSAGAQVIAPGDRIAQLVFQNVEQVHLEPVVELSTTQRAQGGFGSTGKK